MLRDVFMTTNFMVLEFICAFEGCFGDVEAWI
jgi:hypothetical protein